MRLKRLIALNDAAGHAPAGAGVRAVGVGLFVDDNGGTVGVKDGMVGAGVQSDGIGEVVGASVAIGLGVDVGQVAGVYAVGVVVAVGHIPGVEVVAGGGKVRRAGSNGMDVKAVSSLRQPR